MFKMSKKPLVSIRMHLLVCFIFCLRLVKCSFHSVKHTMEVVKGNLEPMASELGSASLEGKVHGKHEVLPSFQMQREAIRGQLRSASDPMGGPWNEIHQRLKQIFEEIPGFLKEMEREHVPNSFEDIGDSRKAPTNWVMRCDEEHISLLECYPSILNEEALALKRNERLENKAEKRREKMSMKLRIKKDTAFEKSSSARDYTLARKKHYLNGSKYEDHGERETLRREAAKWKVHEYQRKIEEKARIGEHEYRGEGGHKQSHDADIHYINQIQALLQKAINDGAMRYEALCKAYEWQLNRPYERIKEEIKFELQSLESSEEMNKRLIKLTETSLPGLKDLRYDITENRNQGSRTNTLYNKAEKEGSSLHNRISVQSDSRKVSTQDDNFNIDGENDRALQNKVILQQIFKDKSTKDTFDKITLQFREMKMEMKILEKILSYIKLQGLPEIVGSELYEKLIEQLEECFEKTIEHLVYGIYRNHQKINATGHPDIVKGGWGQSEIFQNEDKNDPAQNTRPETSNLINGLNLYLDLIPFDGFENSAIPSTITSLQYSELQSACIIGLEKAIFGQIAYFRSLNMIGSPDVEIFFKDIRAVKILGKHLHNLSQISYNPSFIPVFSDLVFNKHNQYLRPILKDLGSETQKVLVKEILACSYKSLQKTSEKHSRKLNPEFNEVFSNLINESILVSGEGPQQERQSKSMEFIEKALNYLSNPPNGYQMPAQTVYDNKYYHTQERCIIRSISSEFKNVELSFALDEVQYLLNFYSLKFASSFLKTEFEKKIKEPKYLNILQAMESSEGKINGFSFYRRFFGNGYGLCTLPEFYPTSV